VLNPSAGAQPELRRSGTAGSTKVTAVRFWTFDDVTRVAIETTGAFELKCDRLANPDRLFFDLVGATSALGRKGPHNYPVGDRILRQIRVAEPQYGVTRIVLDLKGFTRFTTSRLESPDRLIIELRNTEAPVRISDPEPPVTATSPRRFIPPAPIRPGRSRTIRLDDPPQLAFRPPQLPPSSLLARLPRPTVTSYRASRVTLRAPATQAAYTPATQPETRKPLKVEGNKVEGNMEASTEPARHGAEELSMTRALGLKIRRVVIDAGHGGHDAGTTGASGLLEKDLVLDVALRLGKLIEQRLNAEVIYTRSDDTFVPLQERTRIANESRADLFLSIHANSSPERTASGVETYYLNFTTSQAALDVAARENASSDKSVFELKDLLQKIAMQDKIDESKELASCVQNSLYAASVHIDSRSRDRGVRKAPFVVLIGASMPSILAEIGFISNPHEATALRRGDGRQRIAEALFKGVSKYNTSLSHYTVAQRRTD
jgi:N-acetylmuramoyl-L-alanine amidase